MWRHERSTPTSQSGRLGGRRRIRSSTWRRRRGRSARAAIRVARAVVDGVDHADVAERGHDHLGHPAQRLGERQRAVGDRADRVQQLAGAPSARSERVRNQAAAMANPLPER